MCNEKVGIVSENEKQEILKLYERKTALNELFLTLNNSALTSDDREFLYQKIVSDLSETKRKYEGWWKDTAEKYQWASGANNRWVINFESNEVFLECDVSHECCN